MNKMTIYPWQAKQWDHVIGLAQSRRLPHAMLFLGPPGTGKTTLAKVLINELNVDEYDVLIVNASRERTLEFLRNKLTGFAQTLPFGEFKIVLLDEADALHFDTQPALRNLMEEFAGTCRFILTCNQVHKIIPALQDRCQGFKIEKQDLTEFTVRVAEVLLAENIDFEVDMLDTYVKATYPSLRKALNVVQQNSINGKLIEQTSSDSSTDIKVQVVELFKQGKIKQAREILCKNVRPDNMDDIFRWCYDNLDLWGKGDEQQDQAILIIRDAVVNSIAVADPEINISAMMVELGRIE